MQRKSRAGRRPFISPFASELLLFCLWAVGWHCACFCKDDEALCFCHLTSQNHSPSPYQARWSLRGEFSKDNFFSLLPVVGSEQEGFSVLWEACFFCTMYKAYFLFIHLQWGSSLPEPYLCTGVSFKGHILDYTVSLLYFPPCHHQDGSPKALYFSRIQVGLGVCWSPGIPSVSLPWPLWLSFELHLWWLLRFLLICCLQDFSSFMQWSPLGHLIYHLGGNKASLILLADWGIWSL